MKGQGNKVSSGKAAAAATAEKPKSAKGSGGVQKAPKRPVQVALKAPAGKSSESKPFYVKKSLQKKIDLIAQYKELKAKGMKAVQV